MADGDDDDDDDDRATFASKNPAITYTRTRKTKTAASATRRRHNIPLCHSTGGRSADAATASGSERSWFSRKAAGWTDDEIRSHLVSGGTPGGSLSMEGDLIQAADSIGRNKKHNERHNKRRSGPRFAWEEEEEEEHCDTIHISTQEKRLMRAAPTLQDIMDEQDQIDLLAPQTVGKDFQSSGNGGNVINDYTRPNRRTNAALAEIAQFYDNNVVKDGAAVPTAATDSIGWRLLRVLGYRSRLGMAFVSLPGFRAGEDNIQAHDLESMNLTMNLSAKHLASKGLRAIRIPSIAQNTTSNETAKNQTGSHSTKQVLTIPQRKINKHGIGYDPFINAPEFRLFHEKREALAKKRGRAADNSESRSTAYFTDNLRRDERQRLWDKNRDSSDNKNELNQRASNQQDGQHMNYAAPDYTDFIGTKASSGFALEDEDDTNVYQDDENDGDGFPKSNSDRSGYYLEIHSPVASEDEHDDKQHGLFHHPVGFTNKTSCGVRKSARDETNVADAWDAWGMGKGDSLKAVTSDGKPPLPGFQLGQQINNDHKTNRWTGPMVPSGYVLQRHIFPADDSVKPLSAYTVNTADCGLGLDLQQQKRQRSVPTVLPHSEHQQQSLMRARNGTELDFNAVKESMKNRFVSSSGDGNDVATTTKSDVEVGTTDKEEWINVSSMSWVPTRLLCKRWGISIPSTSGVASSTKATIERASAIGEEAYFHETVLPKQKGVEGFGESIIGNDTSNREDNHLEETVAGDDIAGPPPNRPSNDVFKSIFDASSDMDISSSEEEEEEELEGAIEESRAREVHMNINSITSAPAPVAERSGSSSSESEASRHRHRREDRHRRKKSHRRRSPSKSPDSRASDVCSRKRKKKKKRHKRSHSRHEEKRRG